MALRPVRIRSPFVRISSFCVLAAGVLSAANAQQPLPDVALDRLGELRPLVGNAPELARQYASWRARRAEAPDGLSLSLGWSKGRSSHWTPGRGRADFDPISGEWTVELSRLEMTRASVWLRTFPEAAETGSPTWIRSGTVALEDGRGRLRTVLEEGAGSELEVDAIAVTRADAHPRDGVLLWGTPGLFERMYSLERLGDPRAERLGGVHLATLGSGTPLAPTRWRLDGFEAIVGFGERLFFKETFDGNGRTCGTCHPAENNFTIDPAFIATLPPDDPLFVAENQPALDSSQNGGLVFENPALMRRLGLIVENLDGFDDLGGRFVMRSVPHLLGLGRTIDPLPNFDQPLVHLTGWGGDGAPGDGSLREFATGAVRQHTPKTLARVPGVDFRLPDSLELSALEAFMRTLGRSAAEPTASLGFRDPRVQAGQSAFFNEGLCQSCHRDGGATGFFFGGEGNFNVNTGVESMTQAIPQRVGERRPPDGGFGTNPAGEFDSIEANADRSYGDMAFNVPSIIEFADTLPGFHSNVTADPESGLTDTVEGAVEFYNSQALKDALFDGATIIDMTPQQVADIGALLRAMNALENIRATSEYVERALVELALAAPELSRVSRLAELAGEENADASRVLDEVNLHPEVVDVLQTTAAALAAAQAGSGSERVLRLERARAGLTTARGLIVQ